MKGRWDQYKRMFDPEYGKKFADNAFKLFEMIYENPNSKVKVVNGLDDFCRGDCKMRESRCRGPIEKDRVYALDWGVKIGREYTGRYFIKLTRKEYKHMFAKKTG